MSNINYTKADFEEALTALMSTLHKCEKIRAAKSRESLSGHCSIGGFVRCGLRFH